MKLTGDFMACRSLFLMPKEIVEHSSLSEVVSVSESPPSRSLGHAYVGTQVGLCYSVFSTVVQHTVK